MIYAATYLVFILSIAFATFGIILTSRLKEKYSQDLVSTLLYFEIFIYAFGFYGIWGQILVRELFRESFSEDTILRISETAMILGLPFLIFAWFMLIRFATALSGRRYRSLMIYIFLPVNFIVVAVAGILLARQAELKPTVLVRDYFLIANLVYGFIASYLIHLPVRGKLSAPGIKKSITAPMLFSLMALQTVLLFFQPNGKVIYLFFIIAFFAGHTFLPVYFYLQMRIAGSPGPASSVNAFDGFCSRHEISPRECEIIKEICNGLSNKEIAAKLFITEQTVKDHTHRIYIKTNVRSRAQLMAMVKEADR